LMNDYRTLDSARWTYVRPITQMFASSTLINFLLGYALEIF
jgi:hypothetical protein